MTMKRDAVLSSTAECHARQMANLQEFQAKLRRKNVLHAADNHIKQLPMDAAIRAVAVLIPELSHCRLKRALHNFPYFHTPLDVAPSHTCKGQTNMSHQSSATMSVNAG